MKHKKHFLKRAKKMAKPVLAVMALLLLPTYALANPVTDGVGWVLDLLTNGISISIAIIAIVILGIAALFGKIQGDMAWRFVLGLILIFGGATLIDLFVSAIT